MQVEGWKDAKFICSFDAGFCPLVIAKWCIYKEVIQLSLSDEISSLSWSRSHGFIMKKNDVPLLNDSRLLEDYVTNSPGVYFEIK